MPYNKKSLKNLDRTKHGMSGTRFYSLYHHVFNRCNREENENYGRYGGRGIKCERDCFEEFMNDMYEDYLEISKQIGENIVSIDRIDNEGNYCKENCRRINISKQQSNRSSNNYLEYGGKKICIRERAKEVGINEKTLRQRVLRGRDATKAIETPVGNNFGNPKPILVIYEGKEYTVKELEDVVPYSRKTIYRKIKRGDFKTK